MTNGKRPYPLPLRVDEVTAHWLSAATGFRIQNAEIVDIIYGTSTKIRVKIEADAAEPKTVIVKGGFEDHSLSMKEMYANEAAYYRDIAPVLPLEAPECWFAGSDPNSHQSIVIIEDLVASSATFLHAQKPMSYEKTVKRVEALARYHAASWNNPEGRWSWLSGRFTDWSMVYAERYLEPDTWRYYCESPRGAAVSATLHDRDWMRRALGNFRQLEQTGPVCVIHGDTHLGNLYETRDDEPGFFDSQPSLTHPFIETAYHITCALDLADRAKWERDLVKVYLEALEANGVTAPDFEQAWHWYRQCLAYGFFIFLINETRFQTEAVNTAYTARFCAALLDHDVKNLIGD